MCSRSYDYHWSLCDSILYPLGIVEDVPVKVGHHFIPVDFVVFMMGEREKPPLTLV
jgi:hypothetical protein